MKYALAAIIVIAILVSAGWYINTRQQRMEPTESSQQQQQDEPASEQPQPSQDTPTSATMPAPGFENIEETVVVPVVEVDGGVETAPPAEEPSAATRIIELQSGGFFFEPKTINAKVGEELTVRVTAKGKHTFTVDELNVNVPTPTGTTDVTFTPNKTGTFTFYCATPGHREAGQVGTITITN